MTTDDQARARFSSGPHAMHPNMASSRAMVAAALARLPVEHRALLHRVRGHEKVPTGGHVEVPAGGQIKVPT
ncbi:hypothetical protein, partial [Mycolicibacter nonchromogenicus]|uniref:hypothetical protein n=1 Tax=Mycolicibacter nonchromogenicus TaxID=1782 RepID=UPI001AD81F6F